MTENLVPWISLTVFTPLLGAILLALVPGEHRLAHRQLTMVFMGMTFALSLPLVFLFDSAYGGYQLTSPFEQLPWIAALGASYYVGVDGISLWLVLLTTFIGPIVVLASWKGVVDRVKEYHIALLVLQTAMLGAFVSLDLLLFYVFWELMLLPMYFLVGIWGGKDRVYAAIKLFLYTMLGSVLMLAAILYVYLKGGASTFDLQTLIEVGRELSFVEQRWLFAAFGLAFLIKVPLFPFHTWLPDAHVQAPTAGSVILASILLKMGTYGLIRYAMPMFPDGALWAAPVIAVLSVIGIVYGAVIAFVQTDIKKLVAYSSVSHLGFVTLGLFALTPAAVTGAVFQSLAHGITTGGLFLGIGMLYERRHTREMSEFGGLAKQMPVFAALFIIVTMGSAGVPGLVGFVGEYLILFGTSQSQTLGGLTSSLLMDTLGGPQRAAFFFVVVAASGVILGALYLLHMVQQTFFGPLTNDKNKVLPDLSLREIVVLMPMVVMTFVMGLFPSVFLKPMEASVDRFVGEVMDHAWVHEEMLDDTRDDRFRYLRFLRDNRADEPWNLYREAGGVR